jgi:hypothetical protein
MEGGMEIGLSSFKDLNLETKEAMAIIWKKMGHHQWQEEEEEEEEEDSHLHLLEEDQEEVKENHLILLLLELTILLKAHFITIIHPKPLPSLQDLTESWYWHPQAQVVQVVVIMALLLSIPILPILPILLILPTTLHLHPLLLDPILTILYLNICSTHLFQPIY